MPSIGPIGFPLQSYVMLGPFPTPGVATILDLDNPRKWDQPQAYGVTGATSTYKGTSVVKFRIQIDLWKPEQFIAWEIFARGALHLPVPNTPIGAAMGIRHPLVNMQPWNISSVVIENVTGFVQSPTGLWTTYLHLLEFKEPLHAIARQIAAIPAVEETLPTAQDAFAVKMKQLNAQSKGLGGIDFGF